MIPRGIHNVLRCCAVVALIAAACRDATSSDPCTPPEVSSTTIVSNPVNVLSVFVDARVRGADSVAIRYREVNNSNQELTPRTFAHFEGELVTLPVLGLRPGTHYTMSTIAYSRCGSLEGAPQQVMTDSLPTTVPSFVATGDNPSEGYVVFSSGLYGLAIDNTGRVVWYYRFPTAAGLNFQPQPNGRYLSRPSIPGTAPDSVLFEIDPLGRITRRLGCVDGLQARLHDFIAEPNGSYWVMCDETRTVDLTSTGGPPNAQVLGVRVQHISADFTTLFQWSAFDHLTVDFAAIDPQDRIGGAYNWTHANALDIDSSGYLYVSFRNLNQIAKIDTRDGRIVWLMGGRANQLMMSKGGAPSFVHQHGLRVAGLNRVILLDNLGDAGGSRAEIYEIDEQHHTATMLKSLGSGSGVVAPIGGNTQVLGDGRTLVSFGVAGRVEEFNSNGGVVWRIDGNPGYVFRAQRIKSLYNPGDGFSR